jgi:hypothetical protein
MASTSATIRAQSVRLIQRLLVAACACVLSSAGSSAVAAMTSSHEVMGLASPAPQWALGMQIGNYNATGLSVQRFGVLGGSVDMTVTLGFGTSDFGVGVDYIRYLGFGLRPIAIADNESYNSVRDKLLPYFGAGLQADSGLGFKFPLGVQYAFPRHPLSVHGGIAIYLGPFMSHRDFGPELWFSLGARLLI